MSNNINVIRAFFSFICQHHDNTVLHQAITRYSVNIKNLTIFTTSTQSKITMSSKSRYPLVPQFLAKNLKKTPSHSDNIETTKRTFSGNKLWSLTSLLHFPLKLKRSFLFDGKLLIVFYYKMKKKKNYHRKTLYETAQ